MVKTFFIALACAAVFSSSSLADGIVADFEMKNLASREPPVVQNFFISGNMITMHLGSSEGKGTVIYRGDKSLMWIIDDRKKEYSEMTKETMEEMGRNVSSAMDQMKAQMATMPPEQRAMIEKMMKGQMEQLQASSAGAKTVPLAFKKTGARKTINGYACEKYDVSRGGETLREMWITDWKNMRDFQETSTAFESMGNFFKGMMDALKDSPFAQSMDNPYSHTVELNGFPVMTTELKNGVPVMEITMKSMRKTNLTDEVFLPPKGYKANTSMLKPASSKFKPSTPVSK